MRTLLLALFCAPLIAQPAPLHVTIARAAERQVGVTVKYDPSYVKLAYPNGDVPLDRGVCSDVVVRAFRKAGIDLQREVHEDMKRNFPAYPRKWGLRSPDRNIDHRRVPNLMTFLQRKNKQTNGSFQTGDIVAWMLPGGLYHVGIVATGTAADGRTPLVVHNIGQGARKEDVLHAWRIIGHYRW